MDLFGPFFLRLLLDLGAGMLCLRNGQGLARSYRADFSA
jgi:hypothetical protein